MTGSWLRWMVVLKVLLGLWLPAAGWAQSCEPRFAITFADGAKGCLSDYDIIGRSPSGVFGSIRRAMPGSGYYALAAAPVAKHCPVALAAQVSSSAYQSSPWMGGSPESRARDALARCQRQLPSDAPPDCACRLIFSEGVSPLTRAEFARYAAAPEAVAQADTEAAAAAPAAAPATAPAVAPPPSPVATLPAPAPAPIPAPTQPPPTSPRTATAPAPAAPATASDDVAELRRQLEQLKAQVAQAQQPPRAEAPAPTRQRAIALVIGNGAYKHLGALANPRRDAMDIAAKLRSFGIEVDLLLDADRNALVKALADHQRKAVGRDVNILYYAGHGLQVAGSNYIAPVDMLADGISAGYVKLNGVALADALEYLPARTRLVFLDACRDNPASRSLVATRSVAAPGLAPMAASSGTLISYATRDGAVAEDGRGRNSPYTAALLQHLDAADDIAVVLRRVRQSVMQATSNRQEPWEYGSLVGDQLVLPRMAR